MTKGIVVLAQNNETDNYVEQSALLAMSLRYHNNVPISLITNDQVPEEYVNLFDKIIPIPFSDSAKDSAWKIENRWKIYHASPYDETIVMDTDMLVLQNIDVWWNFLSNYEMFFTNKVLTYRGTVANTSYYRKTFIANNLPKHVSIDVCSAIVVKLLDCETSVTNKVSKFPSFTHMKPYCQGWNEVQSSWQNQVGVYISKDGSIKVGNYAQTGILHYTETDFIEKSPALERYGNLINV